MTLKDLVPPLDLCKKIPEGKFENSALVWCGDQFFEHITVVPRTYSGVQRDEDIAPAPTPAEIMEDLNIDGICIEYRDSSPHWVVASPYTDKTPAGDNPATAALKLWLEVNKPDMPDRTDRKEEETEKTEETDENRGTEN